MTDSVDVPCSRCKKTDDKDMGFCEDCNLGYHHKPSDGATFTCADKGCRCATGKKKKRKRKAQK